MKLFLVTAILLRTYCVIGQTIDSVDIKQVDSLIKLSRDFTSKRDFEKALKSNDAAEKISLEKVGIESISYGNCCCNRGRINFIKGDFTEATIWFLKSKEIREKAFGKLNLDYAESINYLGNSYRNIGKFKIAESLLIEAKEIRGELSGKMNADYARTLTGLGILYYTLGQYEKTEPLYIEAKNIREKILGKEHPDYAHSLHNLGNLYSQLGNTQKAIEMYTQAKEIREKVLGKENPDYAFSLAGLGYAYLKNQNYPVALALIQESVEIQAKVFGTNNMNYATGLNYLGAINHQLKNYDTAESLYLKSKETIAKIAGKDNDSYTKVLNNLGKLKQETGKYKEAESLYLESNSITEKLFGKLNGSYTLTLLNLVNLNYYVENDSNAEALVSELSNLQEAIILNSIYFLSEQELQIYIKDFQNSQESMFGLAITINKSEILRSVFNNTLFYKGFLLYAANQFNKLLQADTLNSTTLDLFKSSHNQLSIEYSKPFNQRNLPYLDSLKEKSNELEKALLSSVKGMRNVVRQIDWKELQSKLNPDEAAIEFVNYHISYKDSIDAVRYYALIILPDANSPLLVQIFNEMDLSKILNNNNKKQNTEQLSQIYSRGTKPTNINTQEGLFELVWSRLDSFLKGVKTIYYSPSGLLHQINFDAIPIGNGASLSDRYNLIRLGSTRSLVLPDKSKVNSSNEVVMYGGIQYELDTSHVEINSTFDQIASTSPELSFAYSDRSAPQRGINWNYLPGTEKEVKAIANILSESKFPTQVLNGSLATEKSFKNIGNGKLSPRVLHLATHGFFFPDLKDTTNKSSVLSEAQPAFKFSENPMIRSGILLSGANYTWKTGKPFKEGMEDGILTAYEISQMNLSNTELVVLSACETGLGDIQGNEGVYGLQRAFKIAGVKYLIMSLWSVPDEETKEFMISFYKTWLIKKMSIPEAFRTTQKEMQKRYTNPYLWAGFVLVE